MKVTIEPGAAETLLEDTDSESSELKRIVENCESFEADIPRMDVNNLLKSVMGVDNFRINDLSGYDDINSYYEDKLDELKQKYSTGVLTDQEFENKVEELLDKKIDYE